jgi:hypothetical protein
LASKTSIMYPATAPKTAKPALGISWCLNRLRSSSRLGLVFACST